MRTPKRCACGGEPTTSDCVGDHRAAAYVRCWDCGVSMSAGPRRSLADAVGRWNVLQSALLHCDWRHAVGMMAPP